MSNLPDKVRDKENTVFLCWAEPDLCKLAAQATLRSAVRTFCNNAKRTIRSHTK